jgi:hypothetical protein
MLFGDCIENITTIASGFLGKRRAQYTKDENDRKLKYSINHQHTKIHRRNKI